MIKQTIASIKMMMTTSKATLTTPNLISASLFFLATFEKCNNCWVSFKKALITLMPVNVSSQKSYKRSNALWRSSQSLLMTFSTKTPQMMIKMIGIIINNVITQFLKNILVKTTPVIKKPSTSMTVPQPIYSCNSSVSEVTQDMTFPTLFAW